VESDVIHSSTGDDRQLGKMQKVDIRRRICLPVFDPSYKKNDRRHRLPFLQQQQQQQPPQQQQPVRGCDINENLCVKADKISRDAAKMSEDARREKTGKKLNRTKVVKWRSLNNGDSKQRRSNNEQSATEGRTQFCLK